MFIFLLFVLAILCSFLSYPICFCALNFPNLFSKVTIALLLLLFIRFVAKKIKKSLIKK